MDVLLARPPKRDPNQMSLAVPPLGLAYVAASLKRHGHRVRILDADVQGWTWDRFEQELAQTRPEVLGLSAMTPVADIAARAARIARPYARHIILGGPHPLRSNTRSSTKCRSWPRWWGRRRHRPLPPLAGAAGRRTSARCAGTGASSSTADPDIAQIAFPARSAADAPLPLLCDPPRLRHHDHEPRVPIHRTFATKA